MAITYSVYISFFRLVWHLAIPLSVQYVGVMFLVWLTICSTNPLAMVAKSVIFFLLVKFIQYVQLLDVRNRMLEAYGFVDIDSVDIDSVDIDSIDSDSANDSMSELDEQDDFDDLDPYSPDIPDGGVPVEQKVIMLV